MQTVMSLAFLLATVALVQGISKVLPDSITVSNTVGGRELPIYCVQTDKPQIALSFDAAWGNEDTADILETLKKHNVKVAVGHVHLASVCFDEKLFHNVGKITKFR